MAEISGDTLIDLMVICPYIQGSPEKLQPPRLGPLFFGYFRPVFFALVFGSHCCATTRYVFKLVCMMRHFIVSLVSSRI